MNFGLLFPMKRCQWKSDYHGCGTQKLVINIDGFTFNFSRFVQKMRNFEN